MKQTIPKLTLILFLFCSWTFVKAQNLTPREMLSIHNIQSTQSINEILSEKGFDPGETYRNVNSKETITNWNFKPFVDSGDEISSSLTRTVDTLQKTKTYFVLYNPYNYKDFINSLTKSKFKFQGMRVINDKNYSVFKYKKTTCLATERQLDGIRSYFEIVFESE